MGTIIRVTASEARRCVGRLLVHVQRGGEVVITRHDKPVARLIGVESRDLEDVRKAVKGLRALRARIQSQNGRPRLTFAEVKSAVH